MPVNISAIQGRIYEGDTQALKELYDAIGFSLLHLAKQIVCNHHLAEEVVQDVFVNIWEKRDKLLLVENIKWYLYAATRNKSIQYLRRKKRHGVVVAEEPFCIPDLHVDVSPEDIMVTAEMIKSINRAINELPPQCRLIFKLVKEDGLKYREAAELLDLSIKTIENQMGIALKKLHKAIAPDIPTHDVKKVSGKP